MVFAFCSGRPLAKKVLTAVQRIEAQCIGGRSAFGIGLDRDVVDIRPGTNTSEGNTGGCYWEWINSVRQTIDNVFSNGSTGKCRVYASNFEVEIDFCNTFRKVNKCGHINSVPAIVRERITP